MLLIYLQISGLNLGLGNGYLDGEFVSFIHFLLKLYLNSTYNKLAIATFHILYPTILVLSGQTSPFCFQ